MAVCEYDAFCSVCKIAVDLDDDHRLYECEGVCFRSFHSKCLGKSEPADDESMFCDSCKGIGNIEREFSCKICKELGVLHPKLSDEAVSFVKTHRKEKNSMELEEKFTRIDDRIVQCQVKKGKCGGFYHEDCLLNHKYTVFNPSGKVDCPKHICAGCNKKKHMNVAELFSCSECELAYHQRCYPHETRFEDTNYGIVCPKHPNAQIPHDPAPDHFAKNTLEEAFAEMCLFADDLDLPHHSDVMDPNYFRLPEHFTAFATPLPKPKQRKLKNRVVKTVKKERKIRKPPTDRSVSGNGSRKRKRSNLKPSYAKMDNMPPKFVSIRQNQFVKPLTRSMCADSSFKVGVCSCEGGVCGADCDNGCMRCECTGKGPWKNCDAEGDCGNKDIQLGRSPEMEVVETPGMGWGLISKEAIGYGEFVVEYNGEIITKEEKEDRIARYEAEEGGCHYYIMELGSRIYIDARNKGNVSRFMNHSCDPNCELQRWVVQGENRIAIKAVKNIEAGDQLTYDYQFSTGHEIKCMCGSDKCREYLCTTYEYKLRMKEKAKMQEGDESEDEEEN
eukprot:TRINITY_DN773078_c0_g1_i1.p1 TRINITY_DN773078_c0_g1~~TRINITY_DN773078_c0_g1_i1.p1  ORF type:complete len:558 (+),score=131.84 TRINITY_DN773078_c0_g1_i1:148-1821(+)